MLVPANGFLKAIMRGKCGWTNCRFIYKDYDLGRSLHDEIVEPLRSVLIRFDFIKQTALENGALGSGISGSGPLFLL
jgi:homoserine kinase